MSGTRIPNSDNPILDAFIEYKKSNNADDKKNNVLRMIGSSYARAERQTFFDALENKEFRQWVDGTFNEEFVAAKGPRESKPPIYKQQVVEDMKELKEKEANMATKPPESKAQSPTSSPKTKSEKPLPTPKGAVARYMHQLGIISETKERKAPDTPSKSRTERIKELSNKFNNIIKRGR